MVLRWEITGTLLALRLLYVSCVQFTFTPQNTILHQPAVYRCTVDNNGIALTWLFNGTSTGNSSSIISLGIVTQGVGTQNSTLTIPGEATLNETIVICIASGEVYVNSSSDVLYIQGPPTAPKITCSLIDQYNVKCNWTVPYTIAGVEISGYEVNITRGEELLIQQNVVTDTEITYVRGNYKLSVAAVIGDHQIKGETSTVEVTDQDLDIFSNYSFNVEVRNLNGNWMANCTVNVTDIKFAIEPPIPSLMRVIVFSHVSSLICEQYTETITIIEENSTEIVQVVELPDNKKIIITVSVHYRSGLNVSSDDTYSSSTFDVQAVYITQNSSIGNVCFQCSYIDGGSAKGCYIEYTNLKNDFNGSLRILKTEGTECVTDIITGEYNISVYDLESDDTVYTIRPAYQTTTRIENIPVTPSSTSNSSSPSHSGSITPTPEEDKVFPIVIVSVTTCLGSIVLIALLVAVVSLLFYIIKRAKGNNCKTVRSNQGNMELEVSSTHSVYEMSSIGTTPDFNGPKLPPGDLHSPLTYNSVVSCVASIPHRWVEFGASLAITADKLEEIRKKHPDDDHKAFCDVIQEWQTSKIKPFTLGTLKMILND